MSTGRRDVLKMMAGAALYSAAHGINSLAAEQKANGAAHADAPPVATDVILNGTFGLLFSKMNLICFAPTVAGHKYRIDEYALDNNVAVPDPTKLSLKVADGQPGHVKPSDYPELEGNYYSPDADHFSYNPSVVPHVYITLPFPQKIFPHRLLIATLATGNPNVPFATRNSLAGAFVLRYEGVAGSDPPTIDGIHGYKATKGLNNNYQVLITASSSLNMSAEMHARAAWQALAQHFVDGQNQTMSWRLAVSDDSDLRQEGPDPEGITDQYIEDTSAPIEIKHFFAQFEGKMPGHDKAEQHRSTEVTPSVLYHICATAANCKSAGFVSHDQQ